MICVVLHICWRKRLIEDYKAAFEDWQRAAKRFVDDFNVFFIDSCYEKTLPPNVTNTTNYTTQAFLNLHPLSTPSLKRIPFLQRRKALDRFYLTDVEMGQMKAAVTTLPTECTTLVKLTGKYFSESLPPYLKTLSNEEPHPMLGLQARGPSYSGWSSELFLMDRQLMKIALAWRFPRTEMWVDNVRQLLFSLGHNTSVLFFPRFEIKRPVRRSGDRALLKWL